MITSLQTKSQIKSQIDSQNRAIYQFNVPWSETSLSRMYDTVERLFEGGSLVDIVSYKPLSLDKERDEILVEVVLDFSDLFENEDEKDVDSEGKEE